MFNAATLAGKECKIGSNKFSSPSTKATFCKLELFSWMCFSIILPAIFACPMDLEVAMTWIFFSSEKSLTIHSYSSLTVLK